MHELLVSRLGLRVTKTLEADPSYAGPPEWRPTISRWRIDLTDVDAELNQMVTGFSIYSEIRIDSMMLVDERFMSDYIPRQHERQLMQELAQHILKEPA